MPAAGETNVDPDVVVPAAARLAVQAAQMRSVLAAHHQALQGLHGCWSDDEAGQAFEKAYYGEGGTASSNAADNIAEGCQNMCESVEALAENAGISALYSQLEDETSHDDLIAAYQEQYDEFIQEAGEAEGSSGGGSAPEAGDQAGAGQPDAQFVGLARRDTRRRLYGHGVLRREEPELRYGMVSHSDGPPLYRTVTDRDREYYGLTRSRDDGELRALGTSRSELAARRELAVQLETAIENQQAPAPPMSESTEGTHSVEGCADGPAGGVEARFAHRAVEPTDSTTGDQEPVTGSADAGGVEARFAHRAVERSEPAEATTGDQDPVTGSSDAGGVGARFAHRVVGRSEPAEAITGHQQPATGNTRGGQLEPAAEECEPEGAEAPPAEPRPAWELHPPLRRMMARRVTTDPGGEAAGPS